MNKLFFLLLSLQLTLFSQAKYLGEIGSFNDASCFHMNAAGFIYVADNGNDKIFKLDTLGKKLKETGGYGWDQSSFDSPSDIFAATLNVYISDKNNHRIQRFDKDLNFVSSLSTRSSDNKDTRFGYPLSCTVSNQGDMFVLDSENKRIVKFDLFGNFNQNFGGYDWGNYALNDPTELASDGGNNIYAVDGKRILIYDAFGNGVGVIEAEEELSGIKILFNKLTVNTKSSIYIANLSEPTITLEKVKMDVNLDEEIINSLIFNNKLYVLTKSMIHIYSLGQF